MFEIIYKIWCITDAFFAQLIVFNNDDDDLDNDDDDLDNDDNRYNGDL